MNGLAEEVKATGVLEVADKRGRAEGGEISRLEAAYRLHGARVYTLCLRLLADVREAEDATVRVFARFGDEPARAWDETRELDRLRELGMDEALRRLRARRAGGVGRKAAERALPPSAHGGSASFRAPLDAAVLAALAARLPDNLRAAFVLHDYEGLGDAEVAARLRVDAPEARRLIHRARTELRRLRLGGEGYKR